MSAHYEVPRGTCVVCGGNYATAIDGAIRPHRPEPPLEARLRGARTSSQPPCLGSRHLSVEMNQRERALAAAVEHDHRYEDCAQEEPK